MPIGVGAAMLIGSAVAGGTAVAGAKIQSNAAKSAQKSQQAGTDKALAVQQQANQPYMQLGSQAAGRLGQMTANAQPYTQNFTGPGGSNGFQAMPPQGPPPPPMGLGAMGQPPQGAPPGAVPRQGPPAGMSPPGMQGPPQGAPGGMVRLKAPTGEIGMVPDNSPELQKALSLGAVRL